MIPPSLFESEYPSITSWDAKPFLLIKFLYSLFSKISLSIFSEFSRSSISSIRGTNFGTFDLLSKLLVTISYKLIKSFEDLVIERIIESITFGPYIFCHLGMMETVAKKSFSTLLRFPSDRLFIILLDSRMSKAGPCKPAFSTNLINSISLLLIFSFDFRDTAKESFSSNKSFTNSS